MNLNIPLKPKNEDGILRVILPGRISTATQDMASIVSQQEDASSWLQRFFDGPVHWIHLGEQASGWLADRKTMLEASQIIKAGNCDLVLVGELREIYRNPGFQWAFTHECLDHETRFICIWDSIDTADENWEVLMHAASMRHGLTVPETRRRVRRKATHTFGGGGMVLKVKFGYRKLTLEEAASGRFGPVGLRIARLDECTPIIQEMRRRVLANQTFEAVADWLIGERIDPGPYASSGVWTGRLVKDLLSDPILSGRRQFRKEISTLIFKSGKHRAKPNPNMPETEDCPSLSHLTEAEQQELLEHLAARSEVYVNAQRSGRASPLWDVPRSRSIWPGQAARCSACEGRMYQYGKLLKCQNAVPGGTRSCWNHVLVDKEVLTKKVIPFVVRFLDRDPRARSAIAAVAWEEYQRAGHLRQQKGGDLSSQITDLERQRKNLTKAIAMGGELESLLSSLKAIENDLKTAREESERLRMSQQSLGTIHSVADIEAQFEETLTRMASESREFADLLRQLIPRFVIQPVQALDSSQVRPRADLKLSTAAWTPAD